MWMLKKYLSNQRMEFLSCHHWCHHWALFIWEEGGGSMIGEISWPTWIRWRIKWMDYERFKEDMNQVFFFVVSCFKSTKSDKWTVSHLAKEHINRTTKNNGNELWHHWSSAAFLMASVALRQSCVVRESLAATGSSEQALPMSSFIWAARDFSLATFSLSSLTLRPPVVIEKEKRGVFSNVC